MNKAQHASIRCKECEREFDPNWMRALNNLIRGAVEAGVVDFMRAHTVELPQNWRSSLSKRIVGQLVNRIWEIERGIHRVQSWCSDGKQHNAAAGDSQGSPEGESLKLAKGAKTQHG